MIRDFGHPTTLENSLVNSRELLIVTVIYVLIRFSNLEVCCFSVIMDCTTMQCSDLILQINCQKISTSGKMEQEHITFQKASSTIK